MPDPNIPKTPTELIRILRSWFFASDQDIALATGKDIILNGGNIDLNGGDIDLDGGSLIGADHGDLGGLSDNDHPQYILKSIVTAKGDIIAATGNAAVTRLPAGSNDQVLIADSGQSTGLRWGEVPTPLTTKGDIFIHDGSINTRLPVGTDGQVLLADSSQAAGLRWGTPAGDFPIGGVIFWPSDAGTIPTGWAAYAAAAGRFLVGAGGTFVAGATGGAETINIEHSHGPGTLATDSQGAHTHGPGTLATDSDAHTHGPGTLNSASDSHTHGPGTLDTDSDAHTHGPGTLSTNDSNNNNTSILGGGALSMARDVHTHVVDAGITASDSHDHAVDTGATASDSHDHDIDTGATASDSHSHAVDTGATASDGSHSHTATTGASALALSSVQSILPPYLVGTWIQRIS